MVGERTLHGRVVRHLGLRIALNDLAPGAALPDEVELSAQLGVSRTVLREAMKVLAAKGLVESRPKTGTRVRSQRDWNLLDPDVLQWRYEARPDERFLRDLTEVRHIIEPPAAGLAALRADDEEIAAIEARYWQMEATLDDSEAFVDADMGFHGAILAASHNELLPQLSRAIGLPLRFSRLVTVTGRATSEAALPLHWPIAVAIRDRDASAAERSMRDLLQRTAADIERAFRAANDGTGAGGEQTVRDEPADPRERGGDRPAAGGSAPRPTGADPR